MDTPSFREFSRIWARCGGWTLSLPHLGAFPAGMICSRLCLEAFPRRLALCVNDRMTPKGRWKKCRWGKKELKSFGKVKSCRGSAPEALLPRRASPSPQLPGQGCGFPQNLIEIPSKSEFEHPELQRIPNFNIKIQIIPNLNIKIPAGQGWNNRIETEFSKVKTGEQWRRAEIENIVKGIESFREAESTKLEETFKILQSQLHHPKKLLKSLLFNVLLKKLHMFIGKIYKNPNGWRSWEVEVVKVTLKEFAGFTN